ncbi:MAG TPA: hypothetical protein PLS77_13985 [Anaerolineaceae bacterium]|nr:hypothetical protein [Anaerolineaceae bacterium]
MKPWKRKPVVIAGALIVLACLLVVILKWNPIVRRVDRTLRRWDVLEPTLPRYTYPNAPADRQTERRALVTRLYDALEQGDLRAAAELDADLSQEAFLHAWNALNAWEGLRYYDHGGLVPYSTSRWHQIWDPGISGGNLYPWLVAASHYLDPANESSWVEGILYEREVCGSLPCTIDLQSGEIIVKEKDILIEAAVNEYDRDGLLALTEWLGEGPWLPRLEENLAAVLRLADVQTNFGAIPANSAEINGNLLQALTRLYWLTGKEAYLEMAHTVAQAYLHQVLPVYDGFLTNYWDFSNNIPLPEDPRFRPGADPNLMSFNLMDHGGEIIAGLGEYYFLVKSLGLPAAEEDRLPIQAFFDRLLVTGRTPEGLWYRGVDTVTMEPYMLEPLDSWGYNLGGMLAFDLANQEDRYTSAILEMMSAVSMQKSIGWEFGPQADGYADSIESMLYMLAFKDLPAGRQWVDDEIEVMFLKQQPDGFVEQFHLDGNFIRTSLLYALWKTQGASLDSWREDTRLGAELDRSSGDLYLHLAASRDWQGNLRLDSARHAAFWNLPENYPRVNSLPEWFTVDPGSTYRLTNTDSGESWEIQGDDLIAGYPLVLDEGNGWQLNLVLGEQ